MRVITLIITTLLPYLAGCETIEPCDPPTEDVVLEEVLHESDIENLLKDLELDDRTDIYCDQICEYAYRRNRGWRFEGADDCDLQLDAEPGADSSAQVGVIRCVAHGREYTCK